MGNEKESQRNVFKKETNGHFLVNYYDITIFKHHAKKINPER
jgi:hypothetical protein